MSDELGTVNYKRGDRAREIEVLRAHYRQHREALVNMASEAPTDHLAQEYDRLIRDIDGSLGKLDELEGLAPPTPPPPPPPAAAARKTEPGMRPLSRPPVVPPPPKVQPIAEPVYDDDATQVDYVPPEDDQPRPGNTRVLMIVGAGLLVLAAIAGLIWWASSDRTSDTPAQTSTVPIVEDDAGAETATVAPAAPIAAEGLSASPPSHDYGVIRKGTRATRQFEITNNTDEPMTVSVARSTCRCLYYEYSELIPPKAKESITVTVDGAKAAAGALQESIRVSSKKDPTVSTTVEVMATIR